MLIQIPEDKVLELKSKIKWVLGRKKITLRDLQSLCGSLAFCAKALPAGRAFSRRIYLASSHAKKPHHYVRITEGMYQDLLVWELFLDKFNGISYMLDIDWTSNSVLQLFTDSAGGSTKGCGCYFQGKWAFLKWPVEWSGTEVLRDISYLEMIPIALSVYLWEIQKSGSDSRYTSSYNSGGILDHFRPEIAKLLDASNSQNTWKTYNNGLTSFVSFRLEEGLGNTWPPSISHLVNYVAYLSKLGYAPATVKVYLSGLSYYLRINELTDLTSSFIIQKMLKGMDKLYGVVDSRKPITLEILARLINSLQFVCSSVYECKSGMKWDDVVGTVNSIINLCSKIPHALILHCGGNDIGNVPCGALLYHIKFTIAILSQMLPNCSLIWSSILPRRSWRYSSDDHAMEVTRKRINRGVRSYILKHGGYVIKYPDFDDRHPALYSDDGVHLSFIGNDIFLNQIQSALETFIKYPHCVVFPHDHL
ncbi:Hypothetical predicted protein [Mytilus galloprovincialis]|uniref:SGNH hydrolase-type esterase domain-containing protein n=1 Tax=Mytilus galloprovincialis TaxID=29158 RepID=A0A8B6CAK3_MYTGA|nr:Hypothetical predicted protein [Mytilus galloprovincialis]